MCSNSLYKAEKKLNFTDKMIKFQPSNSLNLCKLKYFFQPKAKECVTKLAIKEEPIEGLYGENEEEFDAMQSPLYYATAEYDNYDSNQQYEDVKEDLIKLKKFRCTTCNKTFQHLHHLKRHVSSVNIRVI